MQRTSMWLNLYGCQAVYRKLKKGLKTHKKHFYPFFELMSDSLTTIYVEQHCCLSHQFNLLTQGPIPEIFAKKYWELAEFFELAIDFFLLHPYSNQSQFMGYQGWDEFLMISSKKLGVHKSMRNTVRRACVRRLWNKQNKLHSWIETYIKFVFEKIE